MPKRIDHKIQVGFRLFVRRMIELMSQPIFIVITLLGNACILLGTTVLYAVEHDINPKLHTVLDAVWWAVATVSTVGYGDVSPITNTGKVVGIGMMIIGTALFSAYTALFAGALITTEISGLEKEVRADEEYIHRAIQTMEAALVELHTLRKKKERSGPHTP